MLVRLTNPLIPHICRDSLLQESERKANGYREWIAGRRVNTLNGIRVGTNARQKIILRLEVTLVKQIVYREIEVHETPKAFAHAEINDVDPCGANPRIERD